MKDLFSSIAKSYLVNKLIISLVALVVFLSSNTNAALPSRDWLVDKYEAMDRNINDGEGYSSATNENGNLAWAESYLLESYITMYLATGNKKYLDRFDKHATKVIKNADINRKVRDFRGDLRHGWGSTKYSADKKWFINMVHSGMILYPLVDFSEIIISDQNLKSLLPSADRYLAFAETAVAEFESQWYLDENTGIGEYRFLSDDPIKTNLKAPMPLNGQVALGRVLAKLHSITKKNEYLSKARALALMLKGSLVIDDGGAYIWGYRTDLQKNPIIEDISHGAIELDFALLCYRNGIVFTDLDVKRFAKTLSNNILKGKDISDKVDGSGTVNTYKDSLGRWLSLSPFDCLGWRHFSAILSSDTKLRHPQVMLGIANLVKYYDICKPDAARLSQ